MKKRNSRWVVCVRAEDYPASLEAKKLYRTLPDAVGEAEGFIRVIDESGEDYLYPKEHFEPIAVPPHIQRALHGNGRRTRTSARRGRAARAAR